MSGLLLLRCTPRPRRRDDRIRCCLRPDDRCRADAYPAGAGGAQAYLRATRCMILL